MNSVDNLMALLALFWGLAFVTFRARMARTAVRQAEWLTHRRFNERIYVFMFTYGGLILAALALLKLFGVIK